MMRYWAERFAPGLFVPAAALVALAAQIGSDLNAIRWAVAGVLALLLLAQFRLWDDLADRHRDREAHPDRVLVRTARVWPFAAACVGLAFVNLFLALAWNGLVGLVALLALDLAAGAWYTWRPGRRTAAGDLTVLAKYPAFVVLLAGASWSRLEVWIVALAVYAAACGFEIWHDATGPLRFNS